MNLLISDATLRSIEEFANRWGEGAIRFYPLKICVTMRHLKLILFQPERYMRRLQCYFDFGDDVLFLYEDARTAIEGVSGSCSVRSSATGLSEEGELLENDNFVREVIRFCLDHECELMKLPPDWFLSATKISDGRTRRNFPDIADADLQKKQLFWAKLNTSISG